MPPGRGVWGSLRPPQGSRGVSGAARPPMLEADYFADVIFCYMAAIEGFASFRDLGFLMVFPKAAKI